MPKFSYVSINNIGEPVNGTIEQPDRNSVIKALQKQGLRPISIKEAKKGITTIDLNNIFGSNKVRSDHLVMFTRQLSAMVGAGIPLLRALSALSEYISESPVLKKILINIVDDIEAGASLGDAVSKYPNTFNDVYVNMVRAGESAGILDEILKRLAAQQEKTMTMRKKIKSSMAYPLVLLSITVLAFFGLMIFIVPQIGKILTDLGGADAKLPDITIFMLATSNFIISFWYLILIGLVAIIYGVSAYIRTANGRRKFHRLLLKIPGLNKIIVKLAIARFARTFSALIEAGVAVLEAIAVTSRAVGNVIYEDALVKAEAEVKNGKSLSSVIESNALFPPIVSQMLSVGEETGQTDKILVKVAEFYEEEVDVAIGSISSIIEPVMIVIMGGMVGLIAASVMLPIAGLAQSIK
ncbi:MAG: type II secretion system F family protein [Candidatus Saccharibacteria bacterium]